MKKINLLILVVFFNCAIINNFCADKSIFKIKRESNFEFQKKPAISIKNDLVYINFETKSFCDVSVAVEDSNGKILRHLASGVLGDKAPKPFQIKSKEQQIIWDGKDDQGKYASSIKNNYENIKIRISLGLKPTYEKRLFWSPHKRLTIGKAIKGDAIRMASSPEGVYVSDGTGVDSIRLFNHEGDYVKTIYPFSGEKVQKVKGLNWKDFPQDSKLHPIGNGMMRTTLLTSGSSASERNKYGYAAQFIATKKDNIAIGFLKLNRLKTNGTTEDLIFEGPSLTKTATIGPEDMWDKGKKIEVGPRSVAFSPDGKRIYLSGYGWTGALGRAHEWLNGVTQPTTNRKY